MSSESIPSLGNEPARPALTLVGYEFPLPSTRPLILEAISKLLELGFVQKVILEVGHPIRIWRLVSKDDLGNVKEDESPQIAPEGDLFLSARNAKIIDLAFTPGTPAALAACSPFSALFWSFHILNEKELHPEAIIVHQKSLLASWLNLDSTKDFKTVFGAKVIEHQEMPEGSVLLVGVNPSDKDTAVLSLRLELDIKSEEEIHAGASPKSSSEESITKRTGREKHDRADGKVEVPSRGSSRSGQ